MFNIDVRTVLFYSALIDAISLIIAWTIWRQNRKYYGGLSLWFVAYIMLFISAVLTTLRGYIPDLASIAISNDLLIGGFIVLYIGLQRFVDKKMPNAFNYVLLAAFIIVHGYYTITPNLVARNIAFNSALLIVCIQSAWLMLGKTGREYRPIATGVGISYLLLCLVSIMRIVTAPLSTPPSQNFLNSTALATALVTGQEVLLVLLTFTLVIMVNRRLVGETNKREKEVQERTLELTDVNKNLVQEVDERKRAEMALKANEEKYRNLFENMVEEVHFWKLDRDNTGGIKTWRLVDVNPPALRTWGRQTVDEIRGKTTDEIFGPGSTEHFMPVVQKIMTEGIPYAYEDYFPNLNKYFRFTSVPLGEYFITTGSDITEIKQNEESLSRYAHELEASNKELEAFAYSVSHDLRAPLRTLDGFSQAVIEDYGDKLDDTGKDYLRRVRDAAKHMDQITKDMLTLSRVIRSELRMDNVNLGDIVSTIAKELSEKEPGRKVEFIIAPDVMVKGDASLLQMALFNVLENSWKYSWKIKEARIEFGTIFKDNERIYFIKDNGVGFDMQYADKLFQPFQRLHTDNEYPGTGIGLATVQRVIRRHSGRIWAESQIAKGTTIYFTLG